MPESRPIPRFSAAARFSCLARSGLALGLGLVPLFVTGCSAGGNQPAGASGDSPGQVSDASALRGGDVGPDVVAAHAFFTKYGYFENDALRLTYPSWRPIVGRGPANDAVFGEELAHAVEAFQARSNLPVTGEIDAATRAQMDARFCGVPDSLETDDGEKWAHDTNVDWQSGPVVTYSVTIDASDNIGGLTPMAVNSVIDGAFAAWDAKTNLSFQRVSSGARISVVFVDRPDNILGIGTPTAIFMTNSSKWGTIGQNLSTVVGHEIGHSIGLAHSSVTGPGGALPMMNSTVDASAGTNQPIVPTSDELFAVAASPYTTFQPAFGGEASASDIGSSTAGGVEYTWKIGTIAADQNGSRIYRWRQSSSDWQQINGGSVRIDVAGMVPWIVSARGIIYAKTGVTASNPNGTGWAGRGNCSFVDVGANANGVIWATGGSADAAGDYAIYRYDGATGTSSCNTSTPGARWILVDGRARYVDVAADGSAWVVINAGNIFHRNGVSSSNLGGTSWSRYGGLATDIAVGPDVWGVYGPLYVTGRPGDNLNYILNVQAASGGAAGAPARNSWYQTWSGAKGTSLSVGKDGLPWIVALDNNSWHRTP